MRARPPASEGERKVLSSVCARPVMQCCGFSLHILTLCSHISGGSVHVCDLNEQNFINSVKFSVSWCFPDGNQGRKSGRNAAEKAIFR